METLHKVLLLWVEIFMLHHLLSHLKLKHTYRGNIQNVSGTVLTRK